ncbi:vesicle-associated protein 1-4 [Arabidopsis lyrata subsp. lyrata]|uniref:vesicle-associated protein 1-4 n=1 Tax=Arabidopsis lyrata subsp. lyrata TaxID=81972 RepID=UPI000A29B062|nr:vesicle-associated protein 1-4 [Arabidopsis lyrata subsp. lyrata]|eukprot:XP_020890121.1 vesicle-associated protein 1-4 [Arabidopsis lyrata subsp. lyrata]
MTKSVKKIPMVTISRFMQPPRFQDQVFINFRGEEIRYSFLSHLVAAFKLHGINFFIDKDEQKGKDLKHLFKRIKESQIALAIFSERYAQSRWCLNELAKMKKLARKGKLNVVPIFYKVKVNDVRHQEGKFGSNFWKLAKTSSGEEIKKWKEALEFFSNKMGLTLCGKRYTLHDLSFYLRVRTYMSKCQNIYNFFFRDL